MDKEQMIQNYKDTQAASEAARAAARALEKDAEVALDALAAFAPFQVGDIVAWEDSSYNRAQGKSVKREVVGEIVRIAPHVNGDDDLVFSFRARPYKKDGTPSNLRSVAVESGPSSLYFAKVATLKERGAGLLFKAKQEASNA